MLVRVIYKKRIAKIYLHEFEVYTRNKNTKCNFIKVGIHVEMPKAAPKKSISHFQKLEMILKRSKQNTVRLP